MESAESLETGIYRWSFTVPEDAIDENGHVNNVRYVHWMQDLAVHHWRALGGEQINEALSATWVARSHHIEYLRPAFAGDRIEALTWVASIGRVRSLRKYAFRRIGEEKWIARGETDWVFIDVQTGHPRAIPREVTDMLPVGVAPA
jgi:acyl-CoA thioester hydrolase